MKLSEALVNQCYADGKVYIIKPMLGEKYELNNKKYIFDENVLQEMLDTGKIKIISRDQKWVNIMGIEGMFEDEEDISN